MMLSCRSRSRWSTWWPVLLLSVALGLAGSARSYAQLDLGDFQLIPELNQFNDGPPDADLRAEAVLRAVPGTNLALLQVSVKMNSPWHLYSQTQPAGGPPPTQIKLDDSSAFRMLGSFSPDHPPHVHFVDVFSMDVEEFGDVTWSALVELSDPAAEVSGHLEGLTCADGGGCVPISETDSRFTAKRGAPLSAEQAAAFAGTRLAGTHGTVRGWLSTNKAQPGETVMLYVSLVAEPDWHFYAYAKQPPSLFQKPTLVQANLPAGWSAGPVLSAAKIVSEEPVIPDDPPTRYYGGPATLAMPIQIPESAAAGTVELTGNLAFQTCAKQCDRPTAVAWTASVTVAADADGADLAPVQFATQPGNYDQVAELLAKTASASPSPTGDNHATDTHKPAGDQAGQQQAESGSSAAAAGTDSSTEPAAFTSLDDLELVPDASQTADVGLWKILGAALAGGFVLNFMPCVLPVIGLKIMSFVDQAGSSRIKVFNLNLVYALGMLSVFWLLAVLAAAPALGISETKMGWGEQFNNQGVVIPLISVIFVMALSFLGVWEIPIPGFATSSKANELTEKEGLSGAFFKGVITTVLATPCSAPGLGAAYAYAVNSGSPTLPFLIFTVMGLGMALPYLLIGAFPSLIRFLPKPGLWMDTFKQLMGFVLLGTVIFLMQNVSFPNLLPTVGLMFGLWFACWWVGSVSLAAESSKRMRAWVVSAVIAIVATMISFGNQLDVGDMTLNTLRTRATHKYQLNLDRAVANSATASGGGATAHAGPKTPHGANELPWEPYSEQLLNDVIKDGHTVLVDFTADW